MRKSFARSALPNQLSHDETPSDSSTEGSIPSDNEEVMDVDAGEYDSERPSAPYIQRLPWEAIAKESERKRQAIASEIENIFNSELSSGGAFCFEKTYPAAPNPTLRLVGAGHIGLPVNSRDVLALKEHSRPVKDGSLDIFSAEHTWKVKASKVAFDNPAWSVFLEGVFMDVCKALGIEFAHSEPRCDLHKLWLQGKSSTLPLEKEKLPNAVFATLIITLPCAFTGGELEISHEGASKTIDQARNSLLNTSATAWYRGLTPEFKPITDGHRLALHYHLIHTTTSPHPTLPSLSRAVDRLGKVLTLWKTSMFDPGTPRKIVHLLDNKYSGAKLTQDGLKGRDAYTASVLKDTAEKSGFKLLLAHLELSSRGDARCDPNQKWGRRQCCHSGNDNGREEVEGTDPSRLEFRDHLGVEHGLELSQLGELDGTPLKDKINLEEMLFPVGMQAVESIPWDLATTLRRSSKPDFIEYFEGESKLSAGTLFRSFRRSVLIICPNERYPALILGEVSSKDALDALRSSSSANPTAQEMCFVDCVLGSDDDESDPPLQDVLKVVTTCACRWGNFEVWSKAMDARQGWGGIDAVGPQGLLSALLRLPFDSVTRSMGRIMKNEKSRPRRIMFAFASCMKMKDAGLSTNWILKGLRTDIKAITDSRNVPLGLLIKTIAGAGGMQAVENSVLPALTKKSDPGLNVTVVCSLQRELDSKNSFVPREERGRAERTINTLLSSTINDWKPFAVEREEPKPGGSRLFTYAPRVAHPPNAEPAIKLVKAAMEIKSIPLIEALTQKLVAIPERGDYFELDPKGAIRHIVLPTLKEITESSEREPPEASLVKVVQQLKRGLSNVIVEQKDLCIYDLRTVIFPAVGGQIDAEYIRDGLVSHFCKSQRDLLIYKELCRQLGIWMNESSDQDFKDAIRQNIKHLLMTAANDRKSQYFHSMSSVETVLKLCGELGVAELCSHIFARVAKQVAPLVVQRSPDFVISSLGQFGQWLAEQGYGPMYPSFPELSRLVVTTWREKVLGPMPDGVGPLSATDGISCTCQDCAEVKSYLQHSSPYEKRLDQIGWARINHVVEKTIPHCNGVVRWDTINPRRSKSEPSLWMRKKDETIQGLVWLGKQRAALRALQQITQDEATLKQVLGQGEYRRILVALHVDHINAPLPASPAKGEESASLTVSTSIPTLSASGRPAKRRKIDSA